MTLPLPLKTPLLCWHESLASARNDALIALSPHGARIATTRPLPAGTAVFLELEGGAGIDAVTTDEGDSTGFVVEFVTIDDAAAVLIERALRDSRVDVDDRAPLPPRNVTRPAALLSPPVAATALVVPEGHYANTLVPMFAEVIAPVIAPSPPAVEFAAVTDRVVAPVVVTPVDDLVVEDAVVAPAVEEIVAAPVVVAPVVEDVVVADEEMSIADALRFELDDDDDDALGVAPPSLTAVELPVSSTPPPAMIVAPFDDLHSDDLGDVAVGNFNARPASEAEFESAFFANDDGTPRALPTFADSVDGAAAEGVETTMVPAELDGPSSFETPPMLETFATSPVTEPALPRTRTDELFALQAATRQAPLLSLPSPPPTRTRTALLGSFDMPHTHPMGTVSANFHAARPVIAAKAEAPPPQSMFDAPPAPTASSRETTDKWPSARGILSSEDVAAVEAAGIIEEEIAPPAVAHATLAPDVVADEHLVLDLTGGEVSPPAPQEVRVGDPPRSGFLFDAEFTERHVVPVAAAEVERAQALLDGVGDAFGFDAFDDAIAAATAPAEEAAPAIGEDEPDVFASEPESDVFARPAISDVFASAPDLDVFAASGHEAVEVEVEDDEVELDHRPAPTPYTSMTPVADDNRPLPEPEAEPQESSVGVVDVDFSEFKDVLGPAHRVLSALSTSAPAPPRSTLSSLSLPRPPPSTLPPAPMFPRAPGARETALSNSDASNSDAGASNPFGSGKFETGGLAESSPPPSLPVDAGWSPPGAATMFTAPRLVDRDLDPVLRAGGANSSIGTSSAPRGLPFVGDSSPLLTELDPAELAPVIEHLELSVLAPLVPLPPRRPGSTSQPDELPVVVAAEDDDLPVIGGRALDEYDW